VELDCAARCRIDKIPTPPKHLHDAAGNGPLRPALIRPLGMLGALMAALLSPVVMVFMFFSLLGDWVEGVLGSKADRARVKARAQEAEEQKKAIAAHALDQLFDGDRSAEAGQFLLCWYSHSSHPSGFSACPPTHRARRTAEAGDRPGGGTHADCRSDPTSETVIEDPLLGAHPSDRLRIRFADGSWLNVINDEVRTEIHMHLMRQSHPESHSAQTDDQLRNCQGLWTGSLPSTAVPTRCG
jgi:hypothetical protein